MIIKKRQAQWTSPPSTSSRESQPMMEETMASAGDLYQQELSPEDFEMGLVPDRRAKDRRQGFRRLEDQELISRAHEEANAIRERAAEEGFQEGLNQAAAVIEDLHQAMSDLLNAKEEAYLSVANDLAAMAVDIAEQIIKTEVSCDEALVMSLVENVVSKVGPDQKSVLIKVNPIDVKVVKESVKSDAFGSDAAEFRVMDDPSVDPGSCIVETRAGQIDARFSSQLELLKRMLLTGGKY